MPDKIRREAKVDATGKFTFRKLPALSYGVEIEKNNMCWAKLLHRVKLISENVDNIIFQQQGYEVAFHSSRQFEATLYNKQNPESTRQIIAFGPESNTKYCLSQRSLWVIVPKADWFLFEQEKYEFDAGTDSIWIDPVKVRLSGQVEFRGEITPSQMKAVYITADNGEEMKLVYSDKVATFEISLPFDFKPFTITPGATMEDSYLLFSPKSYTVDAVEKSAGIKFVAKLGMIIQGFITPPLSGVQISIESAEENIAAETTSSN